MKWGEIIDIGIYIGIDVDTDVGIDVARIDRKG